MRLRVRLFGGIAAQAGAPEVELEVPDHVTADRVISELGRQVPDISPLLPSAKLAVNLELATGARPIRQDDEVAVLPPVAGGSASPEPDDDGPVVLTGLRRDGLPFDEALAAVAAPSAGATVLFLGTVRDHSEEVAAVELLVYSAYEEMAEATLREIADELLVKWPDLRGVALLHAVGELPVGAETIAVACSAPHRAEAFDACRHALEEAKRRVPIWKEEVATTGDAHWVGLDRC